jgi:hypothetical protein
MASPSERRKFRRSSVAIVERACLNQTQQQDILEELSLMWYVCQISCRVGLFGDQEQEPNESIVNVSSCSQQSSSCPPRHSTVCFCQADCDLTQFPYRRMPGRAVNSLLPWKGLQLAGGDHLRTSFRPCGGASCLPRSSQGYHISSLLQ